MGQRFCAVKTLAVSQTACEVADWRRNLGCLNLQRESGIGRERADAGQAMMSKDLQSWRAI